MSILRNIYGLRKKLIIGLAALFLLGCLTVLGINLWVVYSTSKYTYTNFSELPNSYKVALVLGTSNRLSDGSPNRYFEQRIQSASILFHLNKVRNIIVSGDNRTIYYNEPKMMKKALVNLGVKESNILLDSAGLRTIDSIVRCHKVMNTNKFIVVTQGFHCHRALFIGLHYNMDIIGFIAPEHPESATIGVHFREYFARVKAVIDLYFLN